MVPSDRVIAGLVGFFGLGTMAGALLGGQPAWHVTVAIAGAFLYLGAAAFLALCTSRGEP